MANNVLTLFRQTATPLCNVLRINSGVIFSLQNSGLRFLYSKSTLGLDGFVQNQEKTRNQMLNIADNFRTKMTEYAQDGSKNMIFTEDLKNMIHLSENDEDINLVVKMIKRFNQQNKQLRFGNYIFGPVVMRLFYVLNRPDIALECFKSEEMSGFFDQLISYQILLDLLFENKKYQEMLDVVDAITDRQLEGAKYPRNIVVLAMAACFKMNSKESLSYALNLWKQLNEVGHLPMRRATTFFAGLALNQGEPSVAIEVLSSARNQNYTTVRNLKAAALSDLGRVDDVIPILKSILSEDMPDSNTHTFNKDVMEKVKTAVTKSGNAEVSLEFNRLEQMLEKQGQISSVILNEQLCAEIQKPPMMNSRERDSRQQPRYQRDFKNQGKSYTYRQRPGLSELV